VDHRPFPFFFCAIPPFPLSRPDGAERWLYVLFWSPLRNSYLSFSFTLRSMVSPYVSAMQALLTTLECPFSAIFPLSLDARILLRAMRTWLSFLRHPSLCCLKPVWDSLDLVNRRLQVGILKFLVFSDSHTFCLRPSVRREVLICRPESVSPTLEPVPLFVPFLLR